MFNIVILSIHGYFGQADVLGLPDTGGQVGISPIQWFHLRKSYAVKNFVPKSFNDFILSNNHSWI